MSLSEAPVRDVRPIAARERESLITFLGVLTVDEWVAGGAAPGWAGKDLALHLVDDDLSWLARERDRWVSWAGDGPVPFWFNLAQESTRALGASTADARSRRPADAVFCPEHP